MFLGIDLTSSETKPSACLGLNDRLEVVYYGLLNSDSDIATQVSINSPRVIAIDAPLSLPLGLRCLEESCGCRPKSPCKGRWCERELAHAAIPCYFTAKKSIIKRMVHRGISLKGALSRQGCAVIEVYPYASKVRLFGKPVPSKTTAWGLDWLREKLSILLNSRNPYLDKWNHDLCDAAVAAYTGFLYAHERAEAVGGAEEGMIYLPRDSCGRREGG